MKEIRRGNERAHRQTKRETNDNFARDDERQRDVVACRRHGDGWREYQGEKHGHGHLDWRWCIRAAQDGRHHHQHSRPHEQQPEPDDQGQIDRRMNSGSR